MKPFFPEKWRLFDWLILVAIGGLSSALVWSFVVQNSAGSRTSPRNGCIANLKQMDGALQQWAQEHKKAATDTYSLTDPAVLRFLRGSRLPECPLGGKYSAAPNVDGAPTCTVPGHTL